MSHLHTIEAVRDFAEARTQHIRSPSLCPVTVVSVCIVTYNHSRYIRQSLDSVLAQQCPFPFEVVIGDDGSTDGTADILKEYQAGYPDKVHLLLATENLGRYTGNGRYNFIRTFYCCRGRYVARLDGDDYWTNPDKLRLQVQQLEAHSEIAFCCHDAGMLRDGEMEPFKQYCPASYHGNLQITDLLYGNYIPTCSVLYRASLLQRLPDWFLQVRYADWAMHVLCAQHGMICYLSQNMGIYRVHPGGVFSRLDDVKRCQWELDVYNVLFRHLRYRYSGSIVPRMQHYRLALAEAYLDRHQYRLAFWTLLVCLPFALIGYERGRTLRLMAWTIRTRLTGGLSPVPRPCK